MNYVIDVEVSGTIRQGIYLEQPWTVKDLVNGTLLTTVGTKGDIVHSETLAVVGNVTVQEVLDDTEYKISLVSSPVIVVYPPESNDLLQ
jgi:hypothetical protein